MLSSSDVHNYLLGLGIAHEIVQLPGQASTVALAAAQLGVAESDVIKSLVFLVDEAPHLVLAPGHVWVDTARLADSLGAKRATLAGAQEVLEATGYRIGAVPPCGLARDLPTIADSDAFAATVVYCGGGDTTTMLKIRSADLRRVVRPRLVDVARRSE